MHLLSQKLTYTFSNKQIHKLVIILLIMHKPRHQCLNGNKLNKVWVNAMVTETLSIPTYRKMKYVNTLRKI
jgi:hypothetical protein